MNLFQRGLGVQATMFAARTRPITPGVRPPLRRVQQPRRQHSKETPKPETDGKIVQGRSPAWNAPETTFPNIFRLSGQQPLNTASAAAGAATAPTAATARSRTFRDVINASPLGRFGRWYSQIQERRPYATQIYSSIIIYLCGDLSAQMFFPPEEPPTKADLDGSRDLDSGEDKKERSRWSAYDPLRTLRHLIVGAGSSIPSYNWFMFLHNNFNFSSKILSVLTKVCVQQIFFTPVFNTYFFSMHSLLAGATLEETWERLKKALPVSVTNSVKLWPAVTAFSFMYVPPQFRNVFSGCVAVGWQTYLSWLNQTAAREVLAAELLAEIEASRDNVALHAMSGKLLSAAGSA
ncbi:hypothetical protein N7495_002414 [Penicillium taxi]|uniref:uncharacterized protein n=1 Tax=Penicillium taxi TaxID=168475 RepID=UPI0025459B66|nr:uncharacterized protein N7495_002414 [Penicillium taxi]KAJ5901886.1 hypothetical protein N7495_002414 [Penicillium taxi]